MGLAETLIVVATSRRLDGSSVGGASVVLHETSATAITGNDGVAGRRVQHRAFGYADVQRFQTARIERDIGAGSRSRSARI